ncbi:class I SAM-dependent methyltransferase [Spirillospora sp. CA-253888]
MTTQNTVHQPYKGASAQDIQFHYDLSNDFYALWLDADLTYSCALWAEGDTLETAQHRKLDYHIEQAKAVGAERVLDIGCGWGSMLRRLTQVHGVGEAVGLTLSAEQVRWIEDLALPGCQVRLESWLDHPVDERYDAITSIGALEHFARPGLSRTERVTQYRLFFERCRSWLPTGGRLALQTIIRGRELIHDRKLLRDLFFSEMIFPESEVPWSSEVMEASEGLFVPIALRNDPDDYARTTQEWLDRLTAHRRQAIALVGEEKAAVYDRYLVLASELFRKRFTCLLRVSFQAV